MKNEYRNYFGRISPALTVAIVFFIVIFIRLIIALVWPASLDSDECFTVVTAMDLRDMPRFYVGCPGQDYMGAFESYYIALLAPLGDWSTRAIRLSIFLLTVIQILLLLRIALRAGQWYGAVFTLLALCAVSPFAYDYALRAREYAIMLVFVLLALDMMHWISLSPTTDKVTRSVTWFGIGLFAGIAFWANELAIFLLIPLAIFPLSRLRVCIRELLVAAIGFVVALTPRLLGCFRSDFAWIKVLIGSFIGISRSDFEQYGWLSIFHRSLAVSDQSVNKAEDAIVALGWPLIILTLVLTICTVVYYLRKKNYQGKDDRLIFGLAIAILIGLLVGKKPRYIFILIPYIVLMNGLLAATLCRRKMMFIALLIFFLIAGGVATSAVFIANGKSADVPIIEVTEFLRDAGYQRGISGYEIAQRLLYYSRRHLAVSSLGGPQFTTRFLDVERLVAMNGAQFVVFASNDPSSSPICDQFQTYIKEHAVKYVKTELNGYIIFHEFSRPIFPGEYLTGEYVQHFQRHTPTNPRKIKQENANILMGRRGEDREQNLNSTTSP